MKEKKTRRKNNDGEEDRNSDESNLWIWITIGVIGLVIISIPVICIIFACIERKRNSPNSGSINEPVAMKGMSVKEKSIEVGVQSKVVQEDQ